MNNCSNDSDNDSLNVQAMLGLKPPVYHSPMAKLS